MNFYEDSAAGTPVLQLNMREHVRLRPGMYVGGTDSRALHHLIYEVLDHAVEETFVGRCDTIKVEILADGQVAIEDNGRGLPVKPYQDPRFIQMEVLLQGVGVFKRDFETAEYEVIGGFHGVGLPAVNALCAQMKVENYRDGYLWEQTYRAGKPATSVHKTLLDDPNQTGTRFVLSPDPSIFQTSEFEFDRLVTRAKELAYVLAGLRVTVRDLRVTPARESEFFFPDGLQALVRQLEPAAAPIQPALYGERTVLLGEKGRKVPVWIAIAIQFSSSPSAHLLSYIDTVELRDGTHLAAMKTTLVKLFNKFRANELGEAARPSLKWKDIAPGLTVAISIRHPNPRFIGPIKLVLGNTEIRAPIRKLVTDLVNEQIQPETMRRYLEFCLSRKRTSGRADHENA